MALVPVLHGPDILQTVDPNRSIRAALSAKYPKQVWYLLASFLTLVSLCHFASLLLSRVQRNRVGSSSRRGAISLRRIPLALVNLFRVLAFRWTVPIGSSHSLNFAEVFLTMAYIAVLFAWTLRTTTNLMGMRFDPKYWANRASNIAATQIPLLTALGMKNNIISLLTGASFDKLEYLHRACGRVICVLIWVHAAGRIKLGLTGSDSLVNIWLRCGLLGATALTVLCLVSIRPIRGLQYEVFLLIHFLLSFIFLLTAYFHAQGGGPGVGYYIWPSFLIWAIDRLLRCLRIIVFNSHNFNPFGNATQKTALDAAVDVLSPYFLRITLRRPERFRWLPGQSAYLTIPSVSSLPFEAHPFTISTIDIPPVADVSQDELGEKNSPSSSEANLRSDGNLKKIVMFIRVRRGFSERLLNAASRDPGRKFTAYLDGPYGSPPLIRGSHTIVLVAGGSGIAFTLPLLLDLIHRTKEGNTECSKVLFIWSIRDSDHIQWISTSLGQALQDVPPSLAVDMRVCVTTDAEDRTVQARNEQPTHRNSNEDEESNTKNGSDTMRNLDSKFLASPLVQVQQGRADLRALLDEAVYQANGAMSVNVCGSRSLAAAVRFALSAPRFFDILKGGPSVTLHVEAFGGA